MRLTIAIAFILFYASANCQVGIGTNTPVATLEIKSSSQSNPSATDGLIIPKVDEFSLEIPGAPYDGMMIFVTGDGSVAKGFYSWDNGAGRWLRLSPSGLELLDEGNGPGWRLIGRGPSGYSNIGDNAVDLSFSNSSVGASGDYAMAVNFNTIAQGLGTFSAGDGTFANGNYAFAAGTKSTAFGNYSAAFNNHTTANAFASFAVGSFNVGGGNSTFWIAEDPIFEVGNGTNFSNRSNALTILKNGSVMAPSLDISEITNARSLITKEYADANYTDTGIAPSGLETITEDGNTGLRVVGAQAQFYEAIGHRGVDLSFSNEIFTPPPPPIATTEVGNGASGNYSFTAGFNTSAVGPHSFASGSFTKARCTSCTAVGEFNVGYDTPALYDPEDPVFEVGNGNALARSNAFTVLRNGYVGIGTHTPAYPLHITSSVGGLNSSPAHYLHQTIGLGSNGSGWTYGLGVSAGVFSSLGFATGSDERIKNIVGQSNGQEDLETLSKIQITDYTFKDHKKYGGQVTKKVIAQQVKRVYPKAVNLSTNYIPNIYQVAKVNANAENKSCIVLSKVVDVKRGDEIKLIDGSNNEYFVTVDNIDGVILQISTSLSVDEIFVFGKKVNDFHNIDYDALSMLNVSATQELYSRIKQLEKENKELKDNFEKRITLMEALVLPREY